MSDAPDPAAAPSPPSKPPRRGPKAHHYAAAVMSFIAFVALGLMAVARFGVLTDWGRGFVVRKLDGLDLGSLGKLRVSGLKGDLWTDFDLQRLAIEDAQGPWIEISNLQVDWSPLELIERRVHIQFVAADRVLLARRPRLEGGGGGGRRPAVRVDQLRARLETLPAFSVERGLFQLAGDLDLEPDGGIVGDLAAQNLLHQGDGLTAAFDLGVGRKVRLDAHAHESRGGAIAGVLGLATGQPFNLDANAEGNVDLGKLKLAASVGAQPIAGGDGTWTRKGGLAKGWVSLTASRWTAGYRAAFGPRLDFVVEQNQLKGPLKQMDARLFADNASLSASGALDAVRLRSEDGLKLQAQIADLSKLVPQPAVGPARFSGLVKGALGDWDLEGQLALGRVSLQGYGLERFNGPVSLSKHRREIRLMASGEGFGGAGGGVLGALTGARPRVQLDATRLADGRTMLRALKLDGTGIKISVSGAKGLLGDLSLKGETEIPNLALARAGAKGRLGLTWTASQGRAGQAWKVGLSGEGAGMALGQEQLDHLLGDKPQLKAGGSWADGVIAVSQIELIGAAARASGSGQVGKDGAVKLVADWSATGPLGLGPLEIDGKARGSALVSGTLAEPRADLGADLERLDLPKLSLANARATLSLAKGPNGLAGAFNLTAVDANGPAHAKGVFEVGADGLSLHDLDAQAGGVVARGELGLRGQDVASADLTASAGPGAFLAAGHADGRLKVIGATAELSLTASDVLLKGETAVVHSLAIKADGPLAELPYSVSAEVRTDQAPFLINGAGVASRSGRALALSFNGGGQLRRLSFKTVSPARISLDGDRRSAQLDLTLSGGRAAIQAEQNGDQLNAKAAMTGVDLAALGEDLAGRFDADLSLSGQGARLDGQLKAQLKGARSRDAPAKLAMNGEIDAALAGTRLTVDAAIDGSGPSDRAQVHAVLPADAAAQPFRFAVDDAKPIEGQFQVTGELQPVWDLFFGDGRELGGQLAAKGALAGTLKSPQVTGEGSLTHGRFEDAGTGLKLREINAEAALSGQTLDLRRFAANDAHAGSLTGQGRLELGPSGSSTLTLTAHGFQLLDNETAKATASGSVTVVQDARGRARLSGALTIDRADISAETSRAPPGVVTMDVVERNRPFSMNQGLQAAPVNGPSLDLDVSITAPRRIYVKGLGLDAELSLDARVVGSTTSPQLEGSAHIVRGDYDFAGNRFSIDDRGVVYLASSPDKIRLDLTATRDNPTLTAIIRIQGTAAKPQITLTSTPTLPDDEVLSQVLFGQSAAQLSPVQAAQVAAAVTTLATGGGFDVMGGLKNFARLDRLALGGGDAATGFSVSGGKYIGSRVYLEVTGGGRQGPSAQVEVKATKSLSLISQVGGEFGAKLAVRWRYDYGRPKPQK